MSKKFIITIVTLIAIAVAAAVAIFLAKGYTFSPEEKRIVGTGIITISSEPDAASVFIDGHLTTATNTTIASLSPKTYDIKVVKEGFIPWAKQVSVKEGLVTAVKVTLFPAIPTIYPLTFTGVDSPILSPDGEKFSFIVPSANSAGGNQQGSSASKKGGIWVWTQARNQQISFTRSSEPHQIAQSITIDFSKAKLRWSADSKQVLATIGNNNYILEADRMNNDPRDITPIIAATLKSWEEDTSAKDQSRILAIKDVNLRQIASSAAVIRWSPDETKFMVVNQAPDKTNLKAAGVTPAPKIDDSVKVYDLEDRKEYSLPPARQHIWLPDSRHVILVEEGTISIVDFDGINKAIIYAGSFKDDFVFPWPDSSRMAIITSFPTPTASEPNLYGINLK
ncbi:PEGA domain-containing protein [Patescibacteria group bacterium]|nr:PEGA domain-containing protein [Patescibacteria group bacterium]